MADDAQTDPTLHYLPGKSALTFQLETGALVELLAASTPKGEIRVSLKLVDTDDDTEDYVARAFMKDTEAGLYVR
jgi:hypothetical protein